MSLTQIARKFANNAVKKGGNNVAVVTERKTLGIAAKVFHPETFTKTAVGQKSTQTVASLVPSVHVTDAVKLAGLALKQNEHSISIKALESGISQAKTHIDALHVAQAAASVMQNVGGFQEPAVSAIKRAIELSTTSREAVSVAQFAFKHQNVGGFVPLSQDALRRALTLANTVGEASHVAWAASIAGNSHGGFSSIRQEALRRAGRGLG